MEVVELFDRSAETALEHAADLQEHLRSAGPELTEARSEMHRLVGDIVSLRNAAELLKRQLAAS